MSDMDPLYQLMQDSAQDMSQASVTQKTMMTADENTDVNIPGYGMKPSYSKQLKQLTGQNLAFIASSEAAGLAKTTSGQYFIVPQGPDSYIAEIMYLNNGGVAQEVERRPSATAVDASLRAPNLMSNSYADPAETLPNLYSFGRTLWAAPSAAMASLGAIQSVTCPPRASTTDDAVNYLFQQDITFVDGGDYLRTEFYFIGNTDLIFTRVVPDASATRISQVLTDMGSGVYKVATLWRVNGVAQNPATVIYWGCQQRGSSVDPCEISYPKIAISGRRINGIGGDITPADLANLTGRISRNMAYNPSADPAYQQQTIYGSSLSWTPVENLPTDVQAISALGAKAAIAVPRVTTGYRDGLVTLPLEGVKVGQYVRVEFGVYVKTDSGVTVPNVLNSCTAFYWAADGTFAQATATVIRKVNDNTYIMSSLYRMTKDGTRVIFGVRNTRTNADFWVFNTKMAADSVPVLSISDTMVRDPLLSLWFDSKVSVPNEAFNPSADPALQQQPTFGNVAWTPLASLPTPVQAISSLGARAALAAPRVTSGFKDALVNLSLDGVKAGQHVRVEFGVYVSPDAGADLSTVLNVCQVFFWYGTTFTNLAAKVKTKISDNIYIMTYEYTFPQDAIRVYFGVRNTRTNIDYWVFNTKMASSSKTVNEIADSLVRDPLLAPWVASQVTAAASPYPPLLTVDAPIAGAEDLILLPDRIFVHPVTPLILQPQQTLMNWTADVGQFLDWSLRGTDVSGRPYGIEFNRNVELDPAKIGTTTSVGFNNRQKPNRWSRRDVTLVRGPATLTGTKTIALIGDSLTNRGQVNRVTTLLTAAGLTINQIGTMSQSEGGRGEGREGWAAAHFVGKRNVINGAQIAISSDRPSSTTKNPFLFEATEAQKTANPAMCFLNTGAVAEQSYAETQTGVFYTFDYRRYLDAQGFSDPDVVTIALAWNDQAAGIAPDQYIAQIRYMVSQIKVACPSAQVAIAPYCPPYSSRAAWNSRMSQYVRNVIGEYKGRAAEGLHIVCSWAIMPSDTAWSSDGSNISRDAMTGSYVDTRSDNIHWDQWGRQYMAYNCLYPFYIWACAQ